MTATISRVGGRPRCGCMSIPADQAEDRGHGARSWTGLDHAGWHTMWHTAQPKATHHEGHSRRYAEARCRGLDAGATLVSPAPPLRATPWLRVPQQPAPLALGGQARRRRRRRRRHRHRHTVAPSPPPDMLGAAPSAHDAWPGLHRNTQPLSANPGGDLDLGATPGVVGRHPLVSRVVSLLAVW